MKELNLLQVVLSNKLRELGISIREASRRSGIPNTTINRMLKGEAIDMPTLVKIAEWLDIPPSNLLDGLDRSNLAAKLSAMLNANPRLKESFEEVVDKINSGQVEKTVVDEIASYAVFRTKDN
jgi:transcriptional regulator with XRE-family HTH domain